MKAGADPFTERRLLKFIEVFREREGTMPTLRDLEHAGFGREAVEAAVKNGKIEMLYVTLTSGTIVKGYRIVIEDIV
jgi:hypothetical protein